MGAPVSYASYPYTAVQYVSAPVQPAAPVKYTYAAAPVAVAAPVAAAAPVKYTYAAAPVSYSYPVAYAAPHTGCVNSVGSVVPCAWDTDTDTTHRTTLDNTGRTTIQQYNSTILKYHNTTILQPHNTSTLQQCINTTFTNTSQSLQDCNTTSWQQRRQEYKGPQN